MELTVHHTSIDYYIPFQYIHSGGEYNNNIIYDNNYPAWQITIGLDYGVIYSNRVPDALFTFEHCVLRGLHRKQCGITTDPRNVNTPLPRLKAKVRKYFAWVRTTSALLSVKATQHGRFRRNWISINTSPEIDARLFCETESEYIWYSPFPTITMGRWTWPCDLDSVLCVSFGGVAAQIRPAGYQRLETNGSDDGQEVRSVVGESQPAQPQPPQPVQHPPPYIGYTQPVQQQAASNTVSLWSLATTLTWRVGGFAQDHHGDTAWSFRH